MNVSVQKALIIYSAVLSTGFAVMLLMGARSPRNQTFDQLQAQRINIVEADGTLRMVIANHDQLPGVIVKGKEVGQVRSTAGGHALLQR